MRGYTLGLRATWLVCIALVWSLGGCSALKSTTSGWSWAGGKSTAGNKHLPYFHKVRWEGETLSLIAKWYTGDWRNWRALAKVNPWVEPNRIYTGVKVKIPRRLLKNKKPMPRGFVLSSASQRGDDPQPTQKSQGETPAGAKAKDPYMEFVIP